MQPNITHSSVIIHFHFPAHPRLLPTKPQYHSLPLPSSSTPPSHKATVPFTSTSQLIHATFPQSHSTIHFHFPAHPRHLPTKPQYHSLPLPSSFTPPSHKTTVSFTSTSRLFHTTSPRPQRPNLVYLPVTTCDIPSTPHSLS